MIVDCHVHFWDPFRDFDILILRNEPAMARPFLPEHLAPLLRAAAIDKCIVIQSAPQPAETDFLIDLVGEAPWVHGIIGWVDLESEDVRAHIARLAARPVVKGVRAMLHRIEDPQWILRPAALRGLEALAAADFTLDLVAWPEHLVPIRQAMAQVAGLRVVVNHGGTPAIASGGFQPWADDLAALAAETNAFCKFSGLREMAGDDPDASDLPRFAAHIYRCFGPSRLLYASNWPVCDLAGGYAAWWRSVHQLLERFVATAQDRAAIFGNNAARAYPERRSRQSPI